jgi:hypothetical protein
LFYDTLNTPSARRSIKNCRGSVNALGKDIVKVEKEIRALVESDTQLKEQYELVCKLPLKLDHSKVSFSVEKQK